MPERSDKKRSPTESIPCISTRNPCRNRPSSTRASSLNAGNAEGDAVEVIAVRALGAVTDELQRVLGVADLDGVRAEAVILARGLALLAGALARAAVAGLDLGRVGAEGQLEAVLGQVLAGGALGAGSNQLPLARDVANLDAGVGVGAPVSAEGAGLASLSGRSDGRGGEDKSGGEVLHFGCDC